MLQNIRYLKYFTMYIFILNICIFLANNIIYIKINKNMVQIYFQKESNLKPPTYKRKKTFLKRGTKKSSLQP